MSSSIDSRAAHNERRHVRAGWVRFGVDHGPLIALLIAFMALALVYNVVTPLGEGPDEAAHMAYVLFLAREHRLPVQRADAASDVPGEGHQPPLAYLVALPAAMWLLPVERQVTLTANPRFVWSGGSEPAAYARGSQECWPWRGTVLAWHLARAVSAVCGACTVWCTWAIARRLGLRRSTALAAAALVAFNPQFVFTSGLVTNDALLAALCAGALLVTVADRRRFADGEASARPVFGLARYWSPALLGLLLGLALLTKQSAVILLVLVPLAAWRRYAWQWRRVLLFVLVCLVTMALVAGWWYRRNIQLYGDALGLAAFQDTFLTQHWDWRDPTAWISALVQLHESFWGRFGWMSVALPGWIYWSIGVSEVLAGVGLLYRLTVAQHSHKGRDHWARVALVILPLVACSWVVSFALTVGLVAWQGRFLFPALPALAVLLACGLCGFDERRGDRDAERSDSSAAFYLLPSAFCLPALLLLAVLVPFAVIAPSYVWYTLPEAQALQTGGQSETVRFAESWKRGVELRAWRLDGRAVPTSTVTVTLTWHALEQLPRNWTVFIHLVDAHGELVAENNTQPLDGRFPMREWTSGDWVRDPHPVVLPPNLSPGTYTLRAGLYDPTRRKQPMQKAWDTAGAPLDPEVELGEVVVEQP